MSSGFKGGDPVELGRKGGLARRGKEYREKPIDEEAEMEKLARSAKTPPTVKQQALAKLADIRDRRRQREQQQSINGDILRLLGNNDRAAGRAPDEPGQRDVLRAMMKDPSYLPDLPEGYVEKHAEPPRWKPPYEGRRAQQPKHSEEQSGSMGESTARSTTRSTSSG